MAVIVWRPRVVTSFSLAQCSLLGPTRKKLEAFQRSSMDSSGQSGTSERLLDAFCQEVRGAANGPSRPSVIDIRNSMCFFLPSPEKVTSRQIIQSLQSESFDRYRQKVVIISLIRRGLCCSITFHEFDEW